MHPKHFAKPTEDQLQRLQPLLVVPIWGSGKRQVECFPNWTALELLRWNSDVPYFKTEHHQILVLNPADFEEPWPPNFLGQTRTRIFMLSWPVQLAAKLSPKHKRGSTNSQWASQKATRRWLLLTAFFSCPTHPVTIVYYILHSLHKLRDPIVTKWDPVVTKSTLWLKLILMNDREWHGTLINITVWSYCLVLYPSLVSRVQVCEVSTRKTWYPEPPSTLDSLWTNANRECSWHMMG